MPGAPSSILAPSGNQDKAPQREVALPGEGGTCGHVAHAAHDLPGEACGFSRWDVGHLLEFQPIGSIDGPHGPGGFGATQTHERCVVVLVVLVDGPVQMGFLVQRTLLGAKGIATRNKCLTSSNKCLTSSNKKLLGTRASLLGTRTLLGALLASLLGAIGRY